MNANSMNTDLTASCAMEISTADTAVQLFPAGAFRATDGRPSDVSAWRMDRQTAQSLDADISLRATPLVIDYEHQTLNTEKNGQPAPAAGWFNRLHWREEKGLFAVGVTWTEKARAMIRAQEYRFISPVFIYDKSGRIRRLLHAGLTNSPALDGMLPLAARQDGVALTAFSAPPSILTPEVERIAMMMGVSSENIEKYGRTQEEAAAAELKNLQAKYGAEKGASVFHACRLMGVRPEDVEKYGDLKVRR